MENPILQALAANLGTWMMTAIGAALVFFFKQIRPLVLNTMLGFASGIMIAASFWSLLQPSIEMSEGGALPIWMPPAIGFVLGAGFLYLADKFLPHMHFHEQKAEGVSTNMRRSALLVMAITLHNIPEGLAVGVAFGAAGVAGGTDGFLPAIAIAMGIGLQNLPEGAAVSIPLRREGLSRGKAFFYGQASGMVEPIAGVIGALLVTFITPILPYALAFAAGAMIYVVVEELIPESQSGSHQGTHFATLGCLIGFVTMMILDLAIG